MGATTASTAARQTPNAELWGARPARGARARSPGLAAISRRALIACSAALVATGAVAGPPPAPAPSARFGPKKRILVATFDTITAFDVAFGGPESGAAIAAQLSTELEQTGDFEVIERAGLDSVLKEQTLNAAKGSLRDAADQAAALLGAQVIVHGFVSTFSENAKTGGFSIGLGGPSTSNTSGQIGSGGTKGVIGIELKLVDVTTGKLVSATHLADTIHTKASTASVTGPVSLSHGQTETSVLGVVTEGVLAKAVAFIRDSLNRLTWVGRVADVDAGQVFINVGRESGVAVGDRFAISRVSKKIVDPESGELLGVVERPVGTVAITAVEDKFSIAEKSANLDVQKGDIARYLQSS